MALKLAQPEAISATVSNLNNQTHPISSIVNYYFAAREDMPAVKLTSLTAQNGSVPNAPGASLTPAQFTVILLS